jgi:hypothetical protein
MSRRSGNPFLLPNHPSVTLDNGQKIYVCAQCESVRSIIVMPGGGDRWLCTKCRTEGRGFVRIPVKGGKE